MSFGKLLKNPIKMFKKDSISFLIIRRHDLGTLNENLTYIAVRPYSSLATLRFKLWHLLQLPDFCDEVIQLKTFDNVVIQLTDLRRGNNDPRKPFILEVWLPEQIKVAGTSKMLTMGELGDIETFNENTVPEPKQFQQGDYELRRHTIDNKRTMLNLIQSDYKHSELSSKHSSIFFKVHAGKSKELANILSKIQSELSSLSIKIGSLESRIKNGK